MAEAPADPGEGAERTARSQLSALVKAGLLVSDSPKGPAHLGFPVEAEQW